MVNRSHAHPPVLLIDDDTQLLDSMQFMLEMAGVGPVAIIGDTRQVLAHLADSPPLVILLDLNMPYLSGLDLLPEIHRQHPDIAIIVLTANQELEAVVECMKCGATDYLTKPVERELLISRVKKTLEMHELRNQLTKLSEQLLTGRLDQPEVFASIVTRSPQMIRIFQYLESIAHFKEPVLITGETGVGKELIAKALHRLTGVDLPFVAENVAGLDENVFADTLFGHVKGAFTGAETERQGLASMAGDGTLMLDEIGDLNSASQIKLLRLVQERSFTPLGADTPRPFRARILVTTHRNLDEAVTKGEFRQDLFYRLTTHKVHIPPLRKRKEDIRMLLEYFIGEAACMLKYNIPMPVDNVINLLTMHAFPGNIRELRALAMDAAAQYKRSGSLPLGPFLDRIKKRTQDPKDTSSTLVSQDNSPSWLLGVAKESNLPTLKEGLKQMEAFLVRQAMERADNNQSAAAAILGLTRQAFYKRLRANKNN